MAFMLASLVTEGVAAPDSNVDGGSFQAASSRNARILGSSREDL